MLLVRVETALGAAQGDRDLRATVMNVDPSAAAAGTGPSGANHPPAVPQVRHRHPAATRSEIVFWRTSTRVFDPQLSAADRLAIPAHNMHDQSTATGRRDARPNGDRSAGTIGDSSTMVQRAQLRARIVL